MESEVIEIQDDYKKDDDNIGATGGSNFEISAQNQLEEKKSQDEFGGDLSSIIIAPMEIEQIATGQFNDFVEDESINLPK